jgi:hypothetical protein
MKTYKLELNIPSKRKRKDFEYTISKSGCYICKSHEPDETGYIRVSINNKSIRIHRLIYESFHGEILKDNVVMHLCDNKRCINPDHFGQGSHTENMKDMVEKGLQGKQKIRRVLSNDEKMDIIDNVENLTVLQLMNKHDLHRTTIQKIRQKARKEMLNVTI